MSHVAKKVKIFLVRVAGDKFSGLYGVACVAGDTKKSKNIFLETLFPRLMFLNIFFRGFVNFTILYH